MLLYRVTDKKCLIIQKSYKNSHIPPYRKQCVFLINQKHVFGYRFLVTNRNVFEEHENTPYVEI